MSRLATIARTAATLLAMLIVPLAVGTAAQADDTALVIHKADLIAGPGRGLAVGNSVEAGQRVKIVRCAHRWCELAVKGPDGWVSIENLSFGQHARGPFTGPRFDIKSGGPGQVCFYTGRDFTGEALCVPSGAVARDLALLGRDNSFASVQLIGNVSVNICRAADFGSYCVKYTHSAERLDPWLERGASSFRVF